MEKYKKLLDYALKLLSYRPRSVKEISDKLKRYTIKKDVSPETISQVINYLKEQNFLNDEDFAKWWLEQRNSFRPKGSRFIKMELKSKGVAKEIIDSITSVDELALAKKVIEKKKDLLNSLKREEKKAKITRLLASRGFSWETIFAVVDEVLGKE